VQVVNLLVTPEQAEKLTLASSQTRIQLVLRNPLDTQTATPPGTMMSALFGTMAARPPSAPGPALGGNPRAARAASTSPRAIPAPPQLPPEIPAKKTRVVVVFNGATRTEVKFILQENP